MQVLAAFALIRALTYDGEESAGLKWLRAGLREKLGDIEPVDHPQPAVDLLRLLLDGALRRVAF